MVRLALEERPLSVIWLFDTLRVPFLLLRVAVPFASRGTPLPFMAGMAFSRSFTESVNGRF